MKLNDFIEKYGNVNVDEKDLKELLGVKESKCFYPKQDEYYYLTHYEGVIVEQFNRNSDITSRHFENNELFATREQAQEHADKQRFLLKMKRDFLDNSDTIDWEVDSQFKYHLSYNHRTDEIKIHSNWSVQCTDLYTTNEEWLKGYIDKYEEEIKKYYFEVEEEYKDV